MNPTPDSPYCVAPKTKLVADDITIGVDVTPLLDAGETVASVVSCALVQAFTADPTQVAATDSALVIGTATPNASPFPDDSTPPVNVAIGCGIQFECTGGTPPTLPQKQSGIRFTRYEFQAAVRTTNGHTRAVLGVILVPA